MRIHSNGFVGIGTTTPDLKLDVSHGTTAEYVATFQNTADNLELKIGTTTGGYLNIQGQVINNNAAYNIGLQTDGGNVGIGTASPAEKLHVDGNIKSTGTIDASEIRSTYTHSRNYGLDNEILFEITDWDDDASVRAKFETTSSNFNKVDDADAPASGVFEVAGYHNVVWGKYIPMSDDTEIIFECWVKHSSGTDSSGNLYAGSQFYNGSKSSFGNTNRYWGADGDPQDSENTTWRHIKGVLNGSFIRSSSTTLDAEYFRHLMLFNYNAPGNTSRFCGFRFYKSNKTISSLYAKTNNGTAYNDDSGMKSSEAGAVFKIVDLDANVHAKTEMTVNGNTVFHDSYHPNADKWTTPRSHTVTLTGEVTGSASQSVDGSGNKTWSIATTLNNDSLNDQYLVKDGANIQAYSAGTGEMFKWQNNTSAGHIQLGFQQQDTDGLHHRLYLKTYKGSTTASGNVDIIVRGSGGSTTSDVLELHSGQRASWQGNDIFTDSYHPNADKWTTPRSHTVTLTGEVTGTTTQSVDGSGNKTWSIATTLNNDSLNDQYVQQLGDSSSGPNYHTPSSRRLDPHSGNPTSAHYAAITYGNGGNVTGQLATHFQSGATYNRAYNSSWSAWSRMFDDDYHPNADKWTTARSHTVTLTGDVTGSASQSVDGSGNKTWTITTAVGDNNHNHDHSDGNFTVNGGLVVEGSINSGASDMGFYQSAGTNLILKGDSNGRSGIFFESEKNGTNINDPSDYGFIQYHPYGYGGSSGESGDFVIGISNDSTDHVILQSPYNGGVKIGYRDTTSGTGLTTQTVFHDAYHPNADKWTTARNHTVTLTGEVTGTASQTVDGTGNKTWTIATTVGNSVLDDQYVKKTGDTMTGELQINARLDVGDGSGNDHEIRIYKKDNDVSDHIQFYNGTTRVGEIGCEDSSWLRINQETSNNIYTPRMIRADGGFEVDGKTVVSADGNNLYENSVALSSKYAPIHSHPYLPLSGGVVTGDVDANSFSADGKKFMDMPCNSTERGPWNPIVSSIRNSGRRLYNDEEFASGNNNVNVYNNQGGTAVTITREDATTNSGGAAPNSSGKVLNIYNNGGSSSPGHGGFYQTLPSEDNHTLVQVFQAKIPTGKYAQIAENAQGNNKTSYWLTDNAGTGKWEWYARVSHCGDSGTFHGGGHVYISGGTGNFHWYLASCTIIDVTEIAPGNAWSDLNDGSGSGLDADLLDGQHGSYYSPTSHSHTSFSGKVDFQGDAAIEGGSGYGVFKGYTSNDNHFIAVRGKVTTGSSTPNLTGGHQTTFVEHAENNDTTGWYFKSRQTGTYQEIARITKAGGMHLQGNKVWHEGSTPTDTLKIYNSAGTVVKTINSI
jgi:hypothetical protein